MLAADKQIHHRAAGSAYNSKEFLETLIFNEKDSISQHPEALTTRAWKGQHWSI